MDIITQLEADHRRVEALFDQLVAAAPAARRPLLNELVAMLSIHASLEEQILYPAVQVAVPTGDELVADSLADHQEVKVELVALDKMTGEEEDFVERIEELSNDIAEHVTEEEETVFALLQEHLDEQTLTELGEQMEAMRAGAPTRPHPNAPNEMPGAMIAAPLAAILDRIRDRVEGRTRA